MQTITHKQLERIVKYLEWFDDHFKPIHNDTMKYFKNLLVESKMFFAITLEYPQTVIDNPEHMKRIINFYQPPKSEYMDHFYDFVKQFEGHKND